MKKIPALILTAIFVLALTLTVPAQSDKVLMGTPVIDGILDEIYMQSVAVTLGEAFHTTGETLDTDVTASAYLLYDADNFYVCVVVNDNDILVREKEYIDSSDNPWENDLVEIWVDEEMLGEKTKMSFDPYGTRKFGSPDPFGLVGESVAAAFISDTFYTVEYAIPLSEKGAEGGTYGFSLQVNDLFPDNHVVALGSQEPVEYTFGGAVELPAPEPEPPAEVVVTDTVVSAPVSAPQTSDFAFIAIMAFAGSAAALITAKKKR